MNAVVGCLAGIIFPGEGGVKGIDVLATVAIADDDGEELVELEVAKLYSIVKEKNKEEKEVDRINVHCIRLLPPGPSSLFFCFQLSLGIFYILLSSPFSCYTA